MMPPPFHCEARKGSVRNTDELQSANEAGNKALVPTKEQIVAGADDVVAGLSSEELSSYGATLMDLALLSQGGCKKCVWRVRRSRLTNCAPAKSLGLLQLTERTYAPSRAYCGTSRGAGHAG